MRCLLTQTVQMRCSLLVMATNEMLSSHVHTLNPEPQIINQASRAGIVSSSLPPCLPASLVAHPTPAWLSCSASQMGLPRRVCVCA